ncbi:MAG: hypothetical protein HYZ28_25345 [Myxococcales bacterium]|nr:hypothetical protein [Myxococcales bacterium]
MHRPPPPEQGLFGSILKASLGATAVLGAAYLVSRLREKKSVEERLARLEKLAEKLSGEPKAQA